MRNAETILSIIRERGRKRLPLEDVYRLLYNPSFYLRAYARVYKNAGAMTEGVNEETVDGMSLAKIEAIIGDIRHERYRWMPVRRTHIPKKNGTLRPLGIPTWSDKLVQEVVRSILEAYYEPQFSDRSHGFRPQRGCHTALAEVQTTWTGTKWFIEGDIKGCFDNINHDVLLNVLRENIRDNRFIRLIQNMLTAGYMENWKYGQTLSGTPQGGIISPLLSNIYMDRLDRFVVETLIPEYTRGQKRKCNLVWQRLLNKAYNRRKRGLWAEEREYIRQYRKLPSAMPKDPDFRRLRYVRYADDFLLGFDGPRDEAEAIKERLKKFLGDTLKLELSQQKTLVTHATTEAARFLGYDIAVQKRDDHIINGRRSVNGIVVLRVPEATVKEHCARFMERGKTRSRKELTDDTDFSIVEQFGSEYRGIVQYWMLAQNVSWFNKLHWVMRGSLLKTLAHKHKSTVMTMFKKYRSSVRIGSNSVLYACLEVIVERDGKLPLTARFGGIPLKRKNTAEIRDAKPLHNKSERSELLQRLLATKCELCGSTDKIEVHHVRKMADLVKQGQKRPQKHVELMLARRRKTLVVCDTCHHDIHAGRPTRRTPISDK